MCLPGAGLSIITLGPAGTTELPDAAYVILQACGHECWQPVLAHAQAEREKREEERIRATHQLERKQVRTGLALSPHVTGRSSL